MVGGAAGISASRISTTIGVAATIVSASSAPATPTATSIGLDGGCFDRIGESWKGGVCVGGHCCYDPGGGVGPQPVGVEDVVSMLEEVFVSVRIKFFFC